MVLLRGAVLEANVTPKLSSSEGGLVTFVYVLQSEIDPEAYYTGLTSDVTRRLDEHNNGHSIHTNKYRPWKLAVPVGFADPAKAAKFETYLKSGSGRAFAKRHF